MRTGPRVALRADASAATGLGHAMRCLALGRALRALGAPVALLSQPSNATLAARARAADVESLALPAAAPPQDAIHTAQALADWHADALVVDHYGLDAAWHCAVRAAQGLRLMAIDDLADRELDADLLLDANLADDHRAKYAGRWPAQRPLLGGPRYALVGPQYADAPRHALQDPVTSIGIFMGGADAAGASLRALEGCRRHARFDGPIEIATTSANPHLAALREACARQPATQLLLDAPDLAAFFARHGLQIGAGGGATWERCCIGVPTLALVVADNQRASVPALAAYGAAAVLEPIDDTRPEAIGRALAALLADAPRRARLAEVARALVDGRGAERAALALLAPWLALRRATSDDAQRLHDWRNDPATREVSLSSALIAWDEHAAWLERTLADPERRLHVGVVGTRPVGTIRFDRLAPSNWRVSLSLDPFCTGLGLGTQLLRAGEADLPRGSTVEAQVLPTNRRSRRLFEAAGYRPEGAPGRWVKAPAR
jgi:UDP-2,4-diacetamido-2,4,6-trideoxy-beta-L-altropyranose hydrolase